MSAGTFKLFTKAKKKLGTGTLKVNVPMRMVLLTTITTPANISLLGSLIQPTEQYGYSSSGKGMTVESWRQSTSSTWVFDGSGPTWTASGGTITAKYACVVVSAAAAGSAHAVCYSTLTTSGSVSVASGNSLTVTINTAGIFQMY